MPLKLLGHPMRWLPFPCFKLPPLFLRKQENKTMHRRLIAIPLFLLSSFSLFLHAEDVLPNERNEQLVKEVEQGDREVANAAWWGFDEEDSTESIMKAIHSPAKKVIIPYIGRPWIIRPLKLRSNLELILEPGVLLLAKKEEFRGRHASIFTAVTQENITIRGYGSTLRMRKKDYQQPPYEKAEWRMGIMLLGCKNVLLEGLRIESSGGDGIYLGTSEKRDWCEDVVIRDCTCDDNHRQGISVISAENLLIENCVMSNTKGTRPAAGIDFEPDSPRGRIVNCLVRNCVMENNAGDAIIVYLRTLNQSSEAVSLRFENCLSRMGTSAGLTSKDFTDPEMRGESGIAIGAVREEGPSGLIEFINCTSENTGREGLRIYDKSSKGVQARFVNCKWSNSWVSSYPEYSGPRVPILFQLNKNSVGDNPGGAEFVNCSIYENRKGPTVHYKTDRQEQHLTDVKGTIRVHNQSGVQAGFGEEPINVSLQLIDASK